MRGLYPFWIREINKINKRSTICLLLPRFVSTLTLKEKFANYRLVIGMTLKEKFANYRWRIFAQRIRELPFVTIMLFQHSSRFASAAGKIIFYMLGQLHERKVKANCKIVLWIGHMIKLGKEENTSIYFLLDSKISGQYVSNISHYSHQYLTHSFNYCQNPNLSIT